MIPLIFIAFVASFLLTYAVRVYALKHDIIDTPNQRSSHVQPTPRGGGVSIVLVAFFVFLGFGLQAYTYVLLALATLIVGGIGFLDDRNHIHPALRLLAHFTTGILIVVASGGLPALVVFGVPVDLGITGDILAVVGVVWLLNPVFVNTLVRFFMRPERPSELGFRCALSVG